MCLIVHHPKGTVLTDRYLADVTRNNPDGFGIMYASKGRVLSRKTLGGADEIVRLYREVGANRSCVLHWRYATHGTVSIGNVHPFHLTGCNVAVAHNGMLDVEPVDAGWSDTRQFCADVLAPLARAKALSGSALATIGSLIGVGNKLAIMHGNGHVDIVNRASGVDIDGAWFSNRSNAPRVAGLDDLDLYARPLWASESADYATLEAKVIAEGTTGAQDWDLNNPEEADALLADWFDAETVERYAGDWDSRAEMLVAIVGDR